MQTASGVDHRHSHGATAANYFLGATTKLHSQLDNLQSYIASIRLPADTYNCSGKQCQLPNYLKMNNYNWHQKHLQQAQKSHIFAIMWGGGSTTSVGHYPTYDGGWLGNKINNYELLPQNLQ